jgi:SulP family sulfate permease
MGASSLLLDKATGPYSLRSDVVGGLVSAAVATPLAMGFGMFAFVALGVGYFPDGALAGLLTAVVVGVACIALGDKSANLYAPRVTTTFFIGILLYGLAQSSAPVFRSGGLALVLAALFSTILLAGVFQALFGLLRLGGIIRLIPQPVMSGFQNAAALLLFLVQLGNVFGFDKSTPFVDALKEAPHARPLSILIALCAAAAMWNAKKLWPRVPRLLVGLAAGTVLYYAMGLAGLGTYLGPTIGSVPFNSFKLPNFPQFVELARAPGVASILPSIVMGALALALIASIDTLLCAKLLARPADPPTDGDRLLLRLGAANALNALAGGITAGFNVGPSRDNRDFGGRTRASALVNAAALLVTLVLLFPALSYLPCVALSAVIMVVAIEHVDPWTVGLVRQVALRTASRRALLDLGVILLVAVLSVTVDIVLAVLLGVAIAALLFLTRMSRSVVRRLYRCTGVRSRKSRSAPHLELLARSGASILAVELQGALFFGSAERLASQVEREARKDARYVILDMRRITELDSTGAQTLRELHARLAASGTRLLLSAAQPSEPAAEQLILQSGVIGALGQDAIFRDLDRAIEWAEDDLLRKEGAADTELGELPLGQASIVAGFTEREIAALEKHVKRVAYEPGRVVFSEGDAGKELFIIARGTANALLRQENHSDLRLVTFARDAVFGELAILDAGPRSASVVAAGELVCHVLSAERFTSLSADDPALAIKLLSNLARQLSLRLRHANRTIQQLED